MIKSIKAKKIIREYYMTTVIFLLLLTNRKKIIMNINKSTYRYDIKNGKISMYFLFTLQLN